MIYIYGTHIKDDGIGAINIQHKKISQLSLYTNNRYAHILILH